MALVEKRQNYVLLKKTTTLHYIDLPFPIIYAKRININIIVIYFKSVKNI